MSKGPVLIPLGDDAPRREPPPAATPPAAERPARASGSRLIEGLPPAPSPAEAPPVEEAVAPAGQAMRTLEVLSARPPSRLGAWALRLGGALAAFAVSLALWEFVTDLLARNEILGWIAIGLSGAFLAVLLAIALREWAAFARLDRLDALQHAAARAATTQDLEGRASDVAVPGLAPLRRPPGPGRSPAPPSPATLRPLLDADAILSSTERRLLAPVDAAALREVEAAARQVALVTAFVPLALADVAAAAASNLRMIRRVAELYGGRSGTLGNWRLTRAVFAHLAATGAVAAGDDLIHGALGGSVLARLSRRFGEGLVNGALTARVGIAAMEVCRPIPFARRPSITGIVQRSLTGLFDKPGAKP